MNLRLTRTAVCIALLTALAAVAFGAWRLTAGPARAVFLPSGR